MVNLSLRGRKIEELQRQQSDLKKSLLGRKNTNAVQEIPLMQRGMQRTMQKKISLKEQKKRNIASRQKAMKQPVPKLLIKSFY